MIIKGEKELSNRIRIVNGEEKECQQIVQIVNGEEKEIWSNNKVFLLGNSPKSIIDIEPKYREKTIDNFFVYDQSPYINGDRWNERHSSLDWSAFTSGHSYDTNSGICNYYIIANNVSTNIPIAYVSRPEKLIKLTSGDIKTQFPDEYMNFTNNNFLISLPIINSIPIDAQGPGDLLKARGQVIKSYDATTGQLSAYLYILGNADYSQAVDIYLYKGNPITVEETI